MSDISSLSEIQMKNLIGWGLLLFGLGAVVYLPALFPSAPFEIMLGLRALSVLIALSGHSLVLTHGGWRVTREAFKRSSFSWLDRALLYAGILLLILLPFIWLSPFLDRALFF